MKKMSGDVDTLKVWQLQGQCTQDIWVTVIMKAMKISDRFEPPQTLRLIDYFIFTLDFPWGHEVCLYDSTFVRISTDLSFQAAQRVLEAPQEEALTTLRDISQNFPTVARSVL